MVVVSVIAGPAKIHRPDLVSHPLLKGSGEGLLAISHGVGYRCCCCDDDKYGGRAGYDGGCAGLSSSTGSVGCGAIVWVVPASGAGGEASESSAAGDKSPSSGIEDASSSPTLNDSGTNDEDDGAGAPDRGGLFL